MPLSVRCVHRDRKTYRSYLYLDFSTKTFKITITKSIQLNLYKRLRTSNSNMANDTLKAQPFAVSALWTWTNLATHSALVLQLDILLHIERGCAQMFQNMCSSVQQLPSVQRFGICFLITIIQCRIFLIKQSA